MRILRNVLAAGIVAALPVLGASPAAADLTGPCAASGTLRSSGVTYDARTTHAATIPLAGDVKWNGSVPGGSGKRKISGRVYVKMPPPLGTVRIGAWSKESSRRANDGTYHYDFPSVLAGIDIPVTGSHTEPGVKCSGTVVVRFEGSGGFGNPAVAGTFALTVISGIALIVSFRPKVV
jgi:hypothetical protein